MGFPVLPKTWGPGAPMLRYRHMLCQPANRSHHAQLLRYVGQLKAPAMVQMRAPRRGGVTGRTQMATMALALAMALAVDDLEDRSSANYGDRGVIGWQSCGHPRIYRTMRST